MSDLKPKKDYHNPSNPLCPKCGNVSAKRGVVNQVWATIQRYRCTFCGKTFQKVIKQKVELNHVLHNPNNPRCPKCGNFSRKSGTHKNAWATVQQYKCIECGKYFQKEVLEVK